MSSDSGCMALYSLFLKVHEALKEVEDSTKWWSQIYLPDEAGCGWVGFENSDKEKKVTKGVGIYLTEPPRLMVSLHGQLADDVMLDKKLATTNGAFHPVWEDWEYAHRLDSPHDIDFTWTLPDGFCAKLPDTQVCDIAARVSQLLNMVGSPLVGETLSTRDDEQA